jgi:pimeloyl-ACP methyl ester carboxylesterase
VSAGSASATARPPAVTRTRIRAGGTQPRLLQAGPADAGEAVVFVHGNPGSCDDWERLVGAVGASGVRAVALDLPDFGETFAPAGFVHDVPTYAGFLAEALGVLGVARVHLVIHDFGGPIGLVWAAMNIDAVASVTLIDTGILPGYRWHRLARIWRRPVLGELFQAISTPRMLRRMLPRQEPRGLPAERCWSSTARPTTRARRRPSSPRSWRRRTSRRW